MQPTRAIIVVGENATFEFSLVGGGVRAGRRQGMLVVGRAADSDIVIEDAYVSLHHLGIVRHRQQRFVIDLESRNGTRLNEGDLVPRVAQRVYDGDVVHLGRSRIEFYA